MSGSPSADPAFDRRRFLGCVWRSDPPGASITDSNAFARVLVQAAPGRLDAIVGAVAAIAGVRVLARDPPGRLTTAVPTDAMAGTLAAISAVPGVLTASIVTSGPEVIP